MPALHCGRPVAVGALQPAHALPHHTTTPPLGERLRAGHGQLVWPFGTWATPTVRAPSTPSARTPPHWAKPRLTFCRGGRLPCWPALSPFARLPGCPLLPWEAAAYWEETCPAETLGPSSDSYTCPSCLPGWWFFWKFWRKGGGLEVYLNISFALATYNWAFLPGHFVGGVGLGLLHRRRREVPAALHTSLVKEAYLPASPAVSVPPSPPATLPLPPVHLHAPYHSPAACSEASRRLDSDTNSCAGPTGPGLVPRSACWPEPFAPYPGPLPGCCCSPTTLDSAGPPHPPTSHAAPPATRAHLHAGLLDMTHDMCTSATHGLHCMEGQEGLLPTPFL